jgi:flagellar basal-body rod protein FlgF
MERGTYAAASNGLEQIRLLDVVTHNLANVNTPGFKREYLVQTKQNFDETLASTIKNDPFAKGDHDRVTPSVHVEGKTDFSVGSIKATSNPLDVALANQNDFLVVSTPEGDRYTRAGALQIDTNGFLVTPDGSPVVGDGGPINVNAPGAYITPSGQVKADRQILGQLSVVRFSEFDGLTRESGTRFALKPGASAPTAVDAQVVPQSLEMSNVTTANAMIEMVTAHRGFQLYSEIARSIDRLNDTANNRVGKGNNS